MQFPAGGFTTTEVERYDALSEPAASRIFSRVRKLGTYFTIQPLKFNCNVIVSSLRSTSFLQLNTLGKAPPLKLVLIFNVKRNEEFVTVEMKTKRH